MGAMGKPVCNKGGVNRERFGSEKLAFVEFRKDTGLYTSYDLKTKSLPVGLPTCGTYRLVITHPDYKQIIDDNLDLSAATQYLMYHN